MVFSSVTFLYFFLPLFLLIYFALPHRVRNGFLLAASVLFYTWGEQLLVFVMLTSTVVDYICGLVIFRDFGGGRAESDALPETRTPRQKLALAASVSINLLLLGVFKYLNFAVDNFNALMFRFGLDSVVVHDFMVITLPLGISFYTFQSMSYTIDVYRGHIKPTRRFIDFACYVTMFPQLVAGPIVRYADVAGQLVHRRVPLSAFSSGARLFVVGLGKKMLIANVLAVPVDAIYGLPTHEVSLVLAWAGSALFALQVYYDFSGYSDMAIGMGRMFGFTIPINFHYPYVAKSVTEFWQRWHISLGTWMRDYVFVPLGSYWVSRVRAYVNITIVFLLVGIWHGASWNFVMFGLVHALCVVFEGLGHASQSRRLKGWLGHVYLWTVIFATMTFYRADTLPAAWALVQAMCGGSGVANDLYPLGLFITPEIVIVGMVAMAGCLPVIPWLQTRVAGVKRSEKTRSLVETAYQVATTICLCGILLLSAMKLAVGTYNPFIYFRF